APRLVSCRLSPPLSLLHTLPRLLSSSPSWERESLFLHMPKRAGAALSHPHRLPDTTGLIARPTVFHRPSIRRGQDLHGACAPRGAPTPSYLQDVGPGVG